jgi:uncharacterized protein (TIGR02265 family)
LQRFTARVDTPIRIQFDPDERLERLSRAGQVRGMFFPRLVTALGPEWAAVQSTLREPPRLGTYLPFSGYPMADYGRLTIAVARKTYAAQPLGEAVRQLERGSIRAFADSVAGRVMLKFIDDPAAALLKLPDIQRMLLGIGKVSAERRGERRVHVEFDGVPTWLDCSVLGSIEGGVAMFGVAPVVDVEILAPDHATFDVEW